MGVRTGLITNADARIGTLSFDVCDCMFMTCTVAVLEDLGVSEYLSPMLISETERVAKPSISIFLAACARGRVSPVENLTCW
jgi:hypothetical protein